MNFTPNKTIPKIPVNKQTAIKIYNKYLEYFKCADAIYKFKVRIKENKTNCEFNSFEEFNNEILLDTDIELLSIRILFEDKSISINCATYSTDVFNTLLVNSNSKAWSDSVINDLYSFICELDKKDNVQMEQKFIKWYKDRDFMLKLVLGVLGLISTYIIYLFLKK